uniref:Reverse transcriptase Ty1/copia-type domain-containing protein n=1 Tax=Solanum lycopersicum TaxID=4081 RepID=A0A3Q7FLM2_SOLLC
MKFSQKKHVGLQFGKTLMSTTNVPHLNNIVQSTDATRYRRVLGELQYLSFTPSSTGYILFFGQNHVSWSSNKQRTIALSSNEAEYRVVASAFAETN